MSDAPSDLFRSNYVTLEELERRAACTNRLVRELQRVRNRQELEKTFGIEQSGEKR